MTYAAARAHRALLTALLLSLFWLSPRTAAALHPSSAVLSSSVSASAVSAASERSVEYTPAVTEAATRSPHDEVTGRGWASIAGCLTCIGGGFYLVTSGKGAILAAMLREGSALALASCIAVCNDAIR